MKNWEQQHAASDDEQQRAARDHLATDPIMAGLMEGRELPASRRSRDLFVDLIDAIVSQQLSVKAAAAIMQRLQDAFPDGVPTPEGLREQSSEQLRAIGLSRAKVRYVHGVAEAVISGDIDLQSLQQMDDEAVIAELTRLSGVGRWTAEMLLLFSLGRRDVFAIGDLGLRTAVSRAYGIPRDDRDALAALAERWRPYRSLACHYLWHSLDNKPSLG